MGLDSVELLMEVEIFFGIRMPNTEAEKIDTVEDMVETVARHLNVTSNENTLQDKVFKQISSQLQQMEITGNQPQLNDLISDYVPANDAEKLKGLESLVHLRLPAPVITNARSSKSWLKKYMDQSPRYDWKTITIEQFVDAVCADNYQKLLDPDRLESKYDIYICIMRITVDKMGVDYYEILPGKSFTSDLGID